MNYLCPKERYNYWTPGGMRPEQNQWAHRNIHLGIRTSENHHIIPLWLYTPFIHTFYSRIIYTYVHPLYMYMHHMYTMYNT